MARFFIDRPIFAWVIAIVVMLAGALSISRLSLEQYPNIAPPKITISANYTGASAETIENSVVQVIEQQMKGLDHLSYMSSSSSSAGSAQITLTFEAGTNPDVAQVQVQNKLKQAESRLPQIVQNLGVSVAKTGTDFLMIVSLVSDNTRTTAIDIGDYISTSLLDPVSRVEGVGDVQALGTGYAMRIWLDPAKLQKYSLMPGDVKSAIQSQNAEVTAGQIGGLPARGGQQINATITARSKLQTPAQFGAIVLKTSTDGAVVHLSDVARIELGGESYDVSVQYNGKPSAAIGIKLAAGANALQTADRVKAKLDELSRFFPAEMQMKPVVAYDTTPFVRISIEEVVKTLLEAIVLVVLIMYLFLQNLRATLIPAIAVPVVLLGTFGVLAAFGYSINTLTMFGMVLAIGLLVDDAIVVVENVERIMSEEGLSPREATRKSMGEITGALVGIALVLSAVFVPMAFFGGSTGVIYRQFSITIVAAMLLSVLVALTLTPALCATLLKPGHVHHTGFFAWFNRVFERNSQRYESKVASLLKRGGKAVAVYALLLGLLSVLFLRLPTSFLPEEDQGFVIAMVQLPSGATKERTAQAVNSLEQYMLQQPEVAGLVTINGMGNGGNAQNASMAFIKLKDWSEREDAPSAAAAFSRRATRDLSAVRDARIFVILPPAIRGLGSSSGFDVELQDLGGIGHDRLVAAREQFLALAAKDPTLTKVRKNGQDDTPRFRLAIDDQKAGAFGLAMADINDTLSTASGGTYVNDFINKSRVKRVYLQGDAPARAMGEDLASWYVRNGEGGMVPFSAFSSTSWTTGSPQLERYNGMSAFEIVGEPAEGVSSGTAMNAIEAIIKQLPEGIGFEWTGQSYQERLSGAQAPLLYAISVLVVFLCLAALYESWSIPFSVILIVPLGVLGAVLAASLRGLSNDVYFQVGLLTTVGLSAKNAILIVEFAKQLQEEGASLIDATLQAVRLRLRPILMTSLAFALGVLPLAISSGAGSASRVAIGTGVLGGMISATVLGIFFIPLAFVAVRTLFSRPAPAPVLQGEAS
ncbi:MAG: efflux RND transporter permease subunit [Zoogloea oleivorans]|jgi:HAE1 family hydrophobic/amphiphilic exporter-1/multidrug efflux pump|uniref:efflux RND transporter permease subunit n=1 Tax=Zoogloea oleivorans TaxID=1552750 RepID=UPI002A365424|nr:efflux RND transporter permease subunit [Zoogloea oleivorans]MDY0037958.1 efflux RND transporter permease subunit [Zoogloea oleivorans]